MACHLACAPLLSAHWLPLSSSVPQVSPDPMDTLDRTARKVVAVDHQRRGYLCWLTHPCRLLALSLWFVSTSYQGPPDHMDLKVSPNLRALLISFLSRLGA